MFWRCMPTAGQNPAWSHRPTTATCLLGLLAALCMLSGCFFFRPKSDTQVQEMANRLSPGMTAEEVLELVGSPQRRGQNLFDKRKEYWIYEFTKPAPKKRRQAPDRDGTAPETVVESELQLLFERGKLVNWSIVSHDN